MSQRKLNVHVLCLAKRHTDGEGQVVANLFCQHPPFYFPRIPEFPVVSGSWMSLAGAGAVQTLSSVHCSQSTSCVGRNVKCNIVSVRDRGKRGNSELKNDQCLIVFQMIKKRAKRKFY